MNKKRTLLAFVASLIFLFGYNTIAVSSEIVDLSLLYENKTQSKLSGILEKSLRFYESVDNYRAIFHKQERSDGKIGPAEKIFLKFQKPWKIYMGWLNTEKKGLQVVYERGKHDGKLAIHKPGLVFGLAPVIFLSQDSPWIKKGSESYNIEDAGIGTFLYDFSKIVVKGAKEKKLKINYLKNKTNLEEQVEVVFEGSMENSGYFARRILVSFHPENALPVRMELYDWNDQLTGSYAYEDLKINIVGADTEFIKQINRSLYRVYRAD